ncbi:hypothetical protein BV898_17730 [Hypsibius exemplaris]|uniref:Nucleoprotein TPR n=1 Tax=Hypsibius exemplaris TaxID=2072580 RepID=A0A9X6NFL7_HYPEX|nr:hypothetical protein BV898_17730 [Hypsibius exemplaris]
MASTGFPSRSDEEMPSSSSAQGPPGASFEDQLLEEREFLRNEINRIHGDHKKTVDLLRSSLEKDLQDANALIATQRDEISKQLRANQDLLRQQDIQTQKNLQSKNALTAAEEQISRLTTEKNNVVLLLDSTQTEIADLRGIITKQSLELSEKFGEVELLKMKLASKDSEIDFLKIAEKGLKSQTDQLRTDVGTLHGHLQAKDNEISRVRAECDRKVKDISKEKTALDDELWQEKRRSARLEETLRQEQEKVGQLQEKAAEFAGVKSRLLESLAAQTASSQQIADDLKKHLTALRTRNEQLEEESKSNENYRTELQEAYNQAVNKVQEEVSTAREEAASKTAELDAAKRELSSAKDLLAYLKHDTTGGPISPELQAFVRGHGFSVPRLYHEYRIVVEKLAEAQNSARAAQADLEARSQSWEQYLADRENEESVVHQFSNKLEKTEGELQQQITIVERLEKQGDTYRRNLRMMEHENKVLKEKSGQLERQLVAVLDGDVTGNGPQHSPARAGNRSGSFRNTQELVEVNLGLYSSVESLSRENFQLKEQIEAAAKNEQEFAQAVEAVRDIVEKKEMFERRMTELANEVQLYRVQNESSLFKDFMRCVATVPDQLESLVSLAGNENAMFAFIRAHGGADLADKFAVVQRETQTLRQELQESKAEAEKRKTDLDRLRATQQSELKSAVESRDRLLNELTTLRNEANAIRVENDNRTAEASRQVTKLSELYERLCASERECSSLSHELNSQKEDASRAAAQCQSLSMEKNGLVSRIEVLTEQQITLQAAVNQQNTTLQEWHQRETRLTRDLQTAQQSLAQHIATEAILQRDIQSERAKVQSSALELAAAKKQLDDLRTGTSATSRPPIIPHTTQTATPSSSIPSGSGASRGSTSSATGVGSSDFALNIIRQSSVQQDALQLRISELERQLAKAQADLAAKSRELETQRAEMVERAKEMNAVKTSMLTDINCIKTDRDVLRVQLNALKTENIRVTAENAKLIEEVRQKGKDSADLMGRYMTELKDHQTSSTAAADLRKETDQLKQTLLISKRREQDLQKSLDELAKKADTQEKALREEIRLLEEERGNAQGWKRALYDQARPASTAFMTDEVQDLTILVEHQKRENESISKQLQLSKEENFANAAKVKSLTQTVSRLQEELQLVMQKQDSASSLTSFHQSYAEQQTILASTMEVNGKLRNDLNAALRETDELKTALKAASESTEALTVRLRDVQHENVRLTEESRTLKEQLETWNLRFGVNQQKDEIQSQKTRIADLEKQLKDQVSESEKRLAGQKNGLTKQLIEKLKTRDEAHKEAMAEVLKKLDIFHAERTENRAALAEKLAELERVSARSTVLRKELEALEATQKDSHDEVQRLRDENAQLREQMNQSSKARAVADESETSSGKSATAARSTAVVTPQTQTQTQTPRVPAVVAVTSVRTPHPPVAAVAPQAQEQHVQPMVQQPETSPAVPTEQPSGSGLQTVATGVRRRAPDEDSSPSDNSAQSPARKRVRVLLKPASGPVSIALRPPSPTSMSDVTSSTTPALAPPTAVVDQQEPASDGRPRTAPSVKQDASASTSFAMPSSVVDEVAGELLQQQQQPQRHLQAGSRGPEEGAVDSSAEVGLGTRMDGQAEPTDEADDDEAEIDEAATPGQGMDVEEAADQYLPMSGVAESSAAQELADIFADGPAEYSEEVVPEVVEEMRPLIPEPEIVAPVPEQSTTSVGVSAGVSAGEDSAQPIVEFLRDDASGEDLDQESLDQILGIQTVGGGDNEDGEVSDDEDDAGEGGLDSDGARLGDDDDDDAANDTEGSASDQASSSASRMLSAGDAGTGGRAASEHSVVDISSQGAAAQETTSALGTSTVTGSISLPTLRPTLRTTHVRSTTSSIAATEPAGIPARPATSGSSSSSVVAAGSGSPQRAPSTTTAVTRQPRAPILPPSVDASSSRSESGALVVLTGGLSAPSAPLRSAPPRRTLLPNLEGNVFLPPGRRPPGQEGGPPRGSSGAPMRRPNPGRGGPRGGRGQGGPPPFQ